MSIVLGVDLGAHLGFSIGDSSKGANGTIIECDVLELEKRSKQLRCSRNTALLVWAREIIKTRGVEVFCREDSTKTLKQASRNPREGRKNLANALEHHAGYAAILEAVAESRGVKIIDPVDPRTLKKFATDNGNADKAQMTNAARMLYKIATQDENAADSAHVCAWAMRQVRNQQSQFAGISW